MINGGVRIPPNEIGARLCPGRGAIIARHAFAELCSARHALPANDTPAAAAHRCRPAAVCSSAVLSPAVIFTATPNSRFGVRHASYVGRVVSNGRASTVGAEEQTLVRKAAGSGKAARPVVRTLPHPGAECAWRMNLNAKA